MGSRIGIEGSSEPCGPRMATQGRGRLPGLTRLQRDRSQIETTAWRRIGVKIKRIEIRRGKPTCRDPGWRHEFLLALVLDRGGHGWFVPTEGLSHERGILVYSSCVIIDVYL